jgi:hypothetical protein
MKTAQVVADNFIEIERKFLISDIDPSMLPDHRETIIKQTSLLSDLQLFIDFWRFFIIVYVFSKPGKE